MKLLALAIAIVMSGCVTHKDMATEYGNVATFAAQRVLDSKLEARILRKTNQHFEFLFEDHEYAKMRCDEVYIEHKADTKYTGRMYVTAINKLTGKSATNTVLFSITIEREKISTPLLTKEGS